MPKPLKITTPVIMLSIMLFSIGGSILNWYIFNGTKREIFFNIAIVLGATAIHFFIMFLSAPIVFTIFRKRFNYSSAWFNQKSFEKSMYRVLRVKDWKSKVPAYDSREYSLKDHLPEEIIMNMCHAEVVHEVICVLSYIPILLGRVIGDYKILILTSMIFSCCHLPFIFIQRFNRPRIISVKNRIFHT